MLAWAQAVLAGMGTPAVIALVLAYLSIYGFTPWALAGYTRTVGQIFNGAVATILLMKVLLFGLAVALIPLASSYCTSSADSALGTRRQPTSRHGLLDMVRLFSVILTLEVGSLVGNYY